jgi:hypothetical protein
MAGCNAANEDDRRRVGRDVFIDVSRGESPVCGQLQVDLIDSQALAQDSETQSIYSSTFARSALYQGMEDNDIRGYLDGMFKEGWNQVSQSHLRLGRRGRNPAYGEFELFRNLQRWADLPLPGAVDVVNAEIRLSLESGPPFAVDVAVYAILKDWNPGSGGINRDNNSPPEPGDAWWVDARYGEVRWSRPGVGHASDHESNADTSAQPLAVARYLPGRTDSLVFGSENLTLYVKAQLAKGKPVLLLYKLLDVYEDSPGSVFEIWSANYGVDGSNRRPQLRIQWRTAHGVSSSTFKVSLEPGRALEIPNLAVRGPRTIMISFVPAPRMLDAAGQQHCDQVPHIEYRLSGSGNDWTAINSPSEIDAEKIDLRISAAVDPVPLGKAFIAEIRDTWITSGAPEDQVVQWVFESPDGRRIQKAADYAGDYTWRVSLNTTAIGRWRYRWRHSLSGHELVSEAGLFDVVAWEPRQVAEGLKYLSDEILASGAAPKSYEMLPFELSFMRLERAAMALPADDRRGSPAAVELLADIRHIREQLSGQPVPVEFEPEPIKSRNALKHNPAEQR